MPPPSRPVKGSWACSKYSTPFWTTVPWSPFPGRWPLARNASMAMLVLPTGGSPMLPSFFCRAVGSAPPAFVATSAEEAPAPPVPRAPRAARNSRPRSIACSTSGVRNFSRSDGTTGPAPPAPKVSRAPRATALGLAGVGGTIFWSDAAPSRLTSKDPRRRKVMKPSFKRREESDGNFHSFSVSLNRTFHGFVRTTLGEDRADLLTRGDGLTVEMGKQVIYSKVRFLQF